jgi:hypothetical protein
MATPSRPQAAEFPGLVVGNGRSDFFACVHHELANARRELSSELAEQDTNAGGCA